MAKKDYVVLNARLGSSEGGIACGPVGGADVGEIEFIRNMIIVLWVIHNTWHSFWLMVS